MGGLAKLPFAEEFTVFPKQEFSPKHEMTKFEEEATIRSNENVTLGNP
jgi:hypothetical protein